MTVSDLVRSQFPDASEEFCCLHGRSIRNSLLTASDWTQLPDAPCDQQAWAEYRQQLRELTADSNWPHVTFPDQPS